MGDRLFGMEAELAVSGRRGTDVIAPGHLVAQLAAVARRTLKGLSSANNRLYLGNGGVFYVDCGDHPEYATPECVTPAEAVSHLRAGERLVERLAHIAGEELAADTIMVSRTNVDYHGITTWGCHESYLGQRPVSAYADWLIPHLVSRIVFTGSGGIDPRSPGIRFSLSPRVAFIHFAATNDSTSNRGIYHLRDESLSATYSRIHVLAGDNACSQRSTWLKIGTTALVVALADARMRRYDWIKLASPVTALHGFARDRNHRSKVLLRGGAEAMMTAVEIQRHLLARVEGCAGGASMPGWAAEVCTEWKRALDLAESPAVEQAHVFDWPLKFALFRREIALCGFTPETVAAWTDALERLLQPKTPALAWLLPPSRVDAAEIDALRARGFVKQTDVDEAERFLAGHELSWQGLGDFIALRRQLCATDMRFGEVGSGIFDSLDRQGLVPDQRVVSDGQIATAATDPPNGTRAAARAHWVRKLANRNDRYICDWSGILGKGVRLALDDPFATRGQWVRQRRERGVADVFELLRVRL